MWAHLQQRYWLFLDITHLCRGVRRPAGFLAFLHGRNRPVNNETILGYYSYNVKNYFVFICNIVMADLRVVLPDEGGPVIDI